MAYSNILLIDDDEDDQELFLSAVSQISTAVACTALADATQALSKLTSEELKPQAIFLDLNMPVMDGEQFLMEIKKHPNTSDIPVIMFSTSSQPASIQRTRSLGASDYIVKPDNYATLVKILSQYVG